MKKIKTYQTVSIPQEFYDDIKRHVSKYDKYGSIADFVRHSIREQVARDKGIKGLAIEKLDQILNKLEKIEGTENKSNTNGNGHDLS